MIARSSATAAWTMPPTGPRRRRPWLELLAVGGLTPLLFPLSWLLREKFGLELAEHWTGFTFFYAAHLLNDPHFAVTYLLFYRDGRAKLAGRLFRGAQHRRYVLAGVVVPLALLAWCAAALASGSAAAMGAMAELMLLLVGWHYVKQGFGVMMVLAARRGIAYGLAERRALLLHCYAGWAFAWASPHATSRLVAQKGVVYWSLPRPALLEHLTLLAFALSSALVLALLARKVCREGARVFGIPLVGFLAAVWTWTVLAGVDPLVRYAVPALHSLQYLYFVRLLRHSEATAREREPFFEAPARTRVTTLAIGALALGFLLFDIAPALLDHGILAWTAESEAMGRTPAFAALFIAINLHHYFMDAVIWRRDNPETHYLVEVNGRASSRLRASAASKSAASGRPL